VTDSTAVARSDEPELPPLSPEHYAALTAGGLDPLVVIERGYASLCRADAGHAALLEGERFTRGAREHLAVSPGLFVPAFNPEGLRVSGQVRWDVPREAGDHKGQVKSIKYDQPVGRTPPLDVHPRNLGAIKDPAVPVWITEGIKKGDALTGLGLCAVSLAGVWNWKTAGAAQPDWESIPVKGRKVRIVFDADAAVKPEVAKAQERFALWLRDTKGADVAIAVLPGDVDGTECKGVDDHLAAGFTRADLEATLTTDIPESAAVTRTEASRALSAAADLVTDKVLSAEVVERLLTDRYVWSGAMGWMAWDGHLWERHGNAETEVTHEIRTWLEEWCNDRVTDLHTSGRLATKAGLDEVNVYRVVKNNSKVNSTREAASGYPEILVDPTTFDGDPDILNTPAGAVDLRTGRLSPPDPKVRVTRSTSVPYVAGATHPDWDTALEALPDPSVRDWFQLRLGQAITGHMTPDDVMLLMHGGGSNGKSTIMDAVMLAVGSYVSYVPQKLLLGRPDDHPTDLMTLMGTRLALVEELPDDKHLNVTALKTTVGTSFITGRYMRCDFVTFPNQSTLIVNTNYRPSVTETDHGTWRRLLQLTFPMRYLAEDKELEGPGDAYGDPTLRQRVKTDPAVHTAVLAWLVEGARRWYALDRIMPPAPASVNRDTRAWREANDVLFGFAQESLTVDPEHHVMSQELLTEFNDYLKALGHGAWSDKTLANRLLGHPEIGTRLIKRRVYAGESASTLSRPRGRHGRPDSDRYMAYVGLRFGNEDPPPAEPEDPFGPVSGASGPDTSPDTPDVPPDDPEPMPTPPTDPTDQDVPAPALVAFDIETPDADELFAWTADRGPFARLCGYAVDGGEPVTTTDPAELLSVLEAADTITGHRILGYDLPALALHHHGDADPVELYERLAAKAHDALIVARQADPPSAKHGNGATHYDLDSLGERVLGAGKGGDLKALKAEFGGYHLIPVDDPRYVAYLEQDVRLSRDLAPMFGQTDYTRREHRFLTACGSMTLRGVRVDTDLLSLRAEEEEVQKITALDTLNAEYGLPLSRVRTFKRKPDEQVTFTAPLATAEGVEWLGNLWQLFGVTNPPRTPKGRLSTKVDALTRVMEHERCPEDLRRALDLMCTANGARVVYATVAKHLVGDRVHPVMSPEQASGRLSITRPGLTVFGKHGGKVRERGIFLPEEGHVMIAFDFDQIDARAVAAHCQDTAYMDLFEGDTDFHTANAIAVFGDASYREVAKKAGHGENYGMGLAGLAKLIMGATGMTEEDASAHARRYLEAVAEAYPDRNRWRSEVRERADTGALLDNGFGRMMRPEIGRGWTQGPALMGQGTTRDLMVEAILAMDPEVRSTILFTVHDEIVCSIPADRADEYAERIMAAMTFAWAPPGAARPVQISCGRSAAGSNWAACYEK